MPKKFGENTKKVEARIRQEAVKQAAVEKKRKEEEDKLWEDNDKLNQRKLERKLEAEKKATEKLQRKQENQKLHDEEMSKLKSAKPMKVEKVTRYEIEKTREEAEIKVAEQKIKQNDESSEEEIEENLNRLQVEGEVARDIDSAIKVLGGNSVPEIDRHPEKRMKAAYLEFEEENLPRLKAENPNMRLSQIKQLLKKEWMKSPKNPLLKNVMQLNSQ